MMDKNNTQNNLKLQQTVRFFETLLRASADGIVITDPANNIIFVNDTFCKLFESSRHDVIETNLFIWLAKLGHNAREIWKGLEIQINEHGIAKDVEFAMKTGEGMRYFSVNSSLLEKIDIEETGLIISIWRDDTQGKMAQEALQSAHDELEMRVKERTTELSNKNIELRSQINERKKAELRLRDTKNYLDTIIKSSYDSIFVVDEKGRFEFGNEAFFNIMDYPESEMLGHSFMKVIHPDFHDFILKRWDEVQRGEGKPYEVDIVRKDGTVRSLSASHTDMELGGKRKYCVIAKDITERKQAEKELRKSEERFRKLIEAEPECVKLLTKENILVDMNPAGLRMIEADSREQVVGKSVLGIIDPEYREPFVDLVKRVFNGESALLEFSITGLKGTKRWLETHSVPLRDENGKINLLLSITRDITQRKQAEDDLRKHRDHLEELVKERTALLSTKTEQLTENQTALMGLVEELNIANAELAIAKERAEAADRLKSIFLATMSHELRTPLNSIIGFTGIIMMGLSGPLNDEQKIQLGLVQNSGNHLLSLINDVLDISKIEAGQLKIENAPFEMSKAIETVVQTVTSLADKQGVALHVDVRKGVGTITSDRRRVEQILFNLLSNAIKFTEKGEVKVECQLSDGQVITRVIDTGIGIKTEHMDYLFKPFVQLENGLSRRFEGTGLGLSISKKLVEMLGGRIWAESDFGKGSVFTFTLPTKRGAAWNGAVKKFGVGVS